MSTPKANSSCNTQDISFVEYIQQDTELTRAIQIHKRSGTVAVSLVKTFLATLKTLFYSIFNNNIVPQNCNFVYKCDQQFY